MRLLVYALIVLGVPSALFLALQPTTAEEAGPAMLAFILLPSIAGWALARGLSGDEAPRRSTLAGMGLATAVVTMMVGVSWAAGMATGAVQWLGDGTLGATVSVLGATIVTSTLEELGWAAGGLRVARHALGKVGGLLVLSVVWALWHLVVAAFAPPETAAMMFPRGDPFAPGPLVGFFAGMLAFRWLITVLRDQSASVWPAVAAHVTGNVWLVGLLGGGWAMIPPEGPWWAFPSATGGFFAVSAAVAAFVLQRPTSDAS